jgi:hypothetical protein
VHTDRTHCDFTLSWNTAYNMHTRPAPVGHTRSTLGGNFVDVSLKVVVLNDVGTAIVRYLHIVSSYITDYIIGNAA